MAKKKKNVDFSETVAAVENSPVRATGARVITDVENIAKVIADAEAAGKARARAELETIARADATLRDGRKRAPGDEEGSGSIRSSLTDEEVEEEIDRLMNSPYVILAKREETVRYRRRQYLYKLRGYERRGKELAAAGLTLEILNRMDKGGEPI